MLDALIAELKLLNTALTSSMVLLNDPTPDSAEYKASLALTLVLNSVLKVSTNCSPTRTFNLSTLVAVAAEPV